jgi:hypothetical protein
MLADLVTGTTRELSTEGGRVQAISPDGRFVIHRLSGNNVRAILYDEANVQNQSFLESGIGQVSFSPDSKYATFISADKDITGTVPSNEGGINLVYLLSLENGSLQVVSRASNGDFDNGTNFNSFASENGRDVVFESTANNLSTNRDSTLPNNVVSVYHHDVSTGTTTFVPGIGSDSSRAFAISQDGQTLGHFGAVNNLQIGQSQIDTYDIFSGQAALTIPEARVTGRIDLDFATNNRNVSADIDINSIAYFEFEANTSEFRDYHFSVFDTRSNTNRRFFSSSIDIDDFKITNDGEYVYGIDSLTGNLVIVPDDQID